MAPVRLQDVRESDGGAVDGRRRELESGDESEGKGDVREVRRSAGACCRKWEEEEEEEDAGDGEGIVRELH